MEGPNLPSKSFLLRQSPAAHRSPAVMLRFQSLITDVPSYASLLFWFWQTPIPPALVCVAVLLAYPSSPCKLLWN